jgi:hypothetical protein
VLLPNSSSLPLLLVNLKDWQRKTDLWNGNRWCYWFCAEIVEMVFVVVVVEMFLLESDRASWNWIVIRRYVATAPTICNKNTRDFRVTLSRVNCTKFPRPTQSALNVLCVINQQSFFTPVNRSTLTFVCDLKGNNICVTVAVFGSGCSGVKPTFGNTNWCLFQ